MPEASASIDVLPDAFGQMPETAAHEDHGT